MGAKWIWQFSVFRVFTVFSGLTPPSLAAVPQVPPVKCTAETEHRFYVTNRQESDIYSFRPKGSN